MSEMNDRSSGGQESFGGGDTQVKRFNPRFQKFKKKVCRFCAKQIGEISYKEIDKLARFTTERGKIMPRRLSGNCAKHQRLLAREIKIARLLALMPFVRD